MNHITKEMLIGTLGELLVQIRLLEHQVQAAPPIKDSGNDLVAVRERVFRAIQVKTTTTGEYSKDRLPDLFHILAVVQLVDDEDTVYLDRSPIFLIPCDKVRKASTRTDRLDAFRMTREHVNSLFAE